MPRSRQKVYNSGKAGLFPPLSDFCPRARHLQKTNGQLPSLKNDVVSLDTELLPLLSPDSPITSDFNSLDAAELNSAQILVEDGPLSSHSDVMSHFPGDASDGARSSSLDFGLNPCVQISTEFIDDFLEEDTFLADFEEFTRVPNLYAPEILSFNAPSTLRTYTSPLPWVVNWCEHEPDQYALSKSTNLSLAPEIVESLLRDYFQFANPTFPIVSEWDVYRLTHPEEIEEGEQIPPMSLALFNAIMFAGSAVRLLFP